VGRRQHPVRDGRAEIAQRAARLLADGDVADFEGARRKAARELGAEHRRDLPDYLALQRALVDYLQLFHGAEQAARIAHLRSTALRALNLLASFQPLLVGPVLYGTAVASTPISLHLRCDEFEAVTRFLLERRFSYELIDTQLRLAGLAGPQRMVKIALTLYNEAFELTVLPAHNPRHPLSAIDGRPMPRIDGAALELLLDSGVLFTADFAGRAAAGD
jgi:hypothetical protein